MGKRELILILVFVAAGIAVYQATAPDRPDNGRGFSVGGILQNLRAAFRHETVKATATREATSPVAEDVRRLAVQAFRGQLTVVGSDRVDVRATLSADVFGIDDAGAKANAGRVTMRLQPEGDALQVEIGLPPSRRRQPVELRLEVPHRLGVKLEGRGTVDISGVADVDIETRAGDVTVRNLSGSLRGEHRDGAVSATTAQGVRLTTRRATIRLEDIRGTIEGEFTDGRALIRNVAAKVTLETRRAEVDLERLTGEVSLAGTDGSVTLREAGAAVTFEGERCRLTLVASQAVDVRATSTDAAVDLQLPKGGITLDAVATDGRLELPADLTLTVTHDEAQDTRTCAGPVAGGGPVWRIRTTGGDVFLRR